MEHHCNIEKETVSHVCAFVVYVVSHLKAYSAGSPSGGLLNVVKTTNKLQGTSSPQAAHRNGNIDWKLMFSVSNHNSIIS
jgi:hypothetical protein